MKKLVEEFIKVTGIEFQDQTDKVREKSERIEWQFRAGTNVIVSKNANRKDRIHLSVNMRFTPNDTKLLTMRNPSFSKAIMEISEICTICSAGHQWVKDKENIVGLAIFSHVDEQKLDRISFHDTWDNVVRVAGHVQKILRSDFSGLSATTNPSVETSEKSMYG